MAKVNTSLDQGEGSLCDSKIGGLKDAAANKVACILDLPGDLENDGQESGTPEGIARKRKRGQESTTELPERFEGRQAKTGQGNVRGH